MAYDNRYQFEPSSLALDKQTAVDKATNTKQAQFSGKELAMSLNQFRQANPNSTVLQEKAFLAAQKNLNQGVLEDVGTDLSIAFGDRLPQMFGGIAGLAGVDAGWDFAAQQQRQMEESKKRYSAKLQEANEAVSASQEARDAQYLEDGEFTAGEVAEDFAQSALDMFANPRAMLSEAVQSADALVSMAATGGAAGVIAKKATQTAIKKRAGEEALRRAATKKLVDKKAKKAAAAVGVGLTGVQEGTSNAIQTRDEILKLDEATLNQSEQFQAMREENPDLSFEDTRAKFALAGARDTALISGLIAAGVGKLTGASDKASQALLDQPTKGAIREIAEAGAKEGVEETIQSGSGQLVSNIQVQEGDTKKQIGEGVGSAAAHGATAGALTGAGVSSTTTGLKATGAGLTKLKPKATAPEPTAQTTPEPEVPTDPVSTYATPEADTAEKATAEVVQNQAEIQELKSEDTQVTAVLEKAATANSMAADALSRVALEEQGTTGEIAQTIADYSSIAHQLNEEVETQLAREDLSDADREALNKVKAGIHGETAKKTLGNAFSNATGEEVVAAISNQMETGEDIDPAQRQAMIDTVAEATLYSNKPKELSSDILTTLAEATQNEKAKQLLTTFAALRQVQEADHANQSKGIQKTGSELLGDFATKLDEVMDALMAGDMDAVNDIRNEYLDYLYDTQSNKLAAVKGVKPNEAGQEVTWSTSGVRGSGSKSATFDTTTDKGRNQHDKYLRAVQGDTDILGRAIGQLDGLTLPEDESSLVQDMGALSEDEVVAKWGDPSDAGSKFATEYAAGNIDEATAFTYSEQFDPQPEEQVTPSKEQPVSGQNNRQETTPKPKETEATSKPQEASEEAPVASEAVAPEVEPEPESQAAKPEADNDFTKEQGAAFIEQLTTSASDEVQADFKDTFGTEENMYKVLRSGKLPEGATMAELEQWVAANANTPAAVEREQETLNQIADRKELEAEVLAEELGETTQDAVEAYAELERFTGVTAPLKGTTAEQSKRLDKMYRSPPAGKEDSAYRGAYLKAKRKYLQTLRARNRAEARLANLNHEITQLRKGKGVVEQDTISVSNRKRISRLSHVLSNAKYGIKKLAAALGVEQKELEAAKGQAHKIRTLLTDTFDKLSATETTKRINATLHAVKEVVDSLGSRSAALKAAMEATYGNTLALGEGEQADNVRELVSRLKSTDLAKGIAYFKDSALFNSEHLLVQESDDPQVQAIQKSFKEFSDVLAGTKLPDVMRDVDGNIHPHFLQTAFISFMETMEMVGEGSFADSKTLESYVKPIEGLTAQMLQGIGTPISDSAIDGIVRRNMLLGEDADVAQMLPEVGVHLAAMVGYAMKTLPNDIKVTQKTINHVSYYGYARVPTTGSYISQGKLGLMAEEYGKVSSRENHVGTPPNKDYSEYPEELQRMAEQTEQTPYYFNAELFEGWLGRLLNADNSDPDTGIPYDLNELAEEFAVTYMGMESDAELAELNTVDARGKQGKKEGVKRDFINAYNLYLRTERGTKPIYFSSSFGVNDRQFLEGEVNPQASKMHRILVRTAFDSKAKPTGKTLQQMKAAYARTKDKRQFDNFLLGMALALGVKVDKQANSISLVQAWQRIEESLEYIKQNEITSALQYANLRYDPENPISFEEIEAVDALIRGVRAPLPIEVDGKTNGPFHANWLLGIGYGEVTSLLEMGGMKQDIHDKDTHHDEAKKDIYVTAAAAASVFREQAIAAVSDRIAKAQGAAKEVWEKRRKQRQLLEQLGGFLNNKGEYERGATKGATTSTVYGGSKMASDNGLVYGAKSGEGFLAEFYSDITDLMQNPSEAAKANVKRWEVIFDEDFSTLSKDKLTKLELTDAQIDMLTGAVGTTVGADIAAGVNSTMSNSNTATADMANATSFMTAAYNIAYKSLAEHVRSKYYRGKPKAVISKAHQWEIEQSLAKMFPNISTSLGSAVMDDRDFRNKLGGSAQVQTISATTKDGSTAVSLPTGVAPLQQLGVAVTPRTIISVDAHMQQMNTDLAKTILKQLQLNVFDAVDIASTADVQVNALLANIAEAMAINLANPYSSIAEGFAATLSAIQEPVYFEGEAIHNSLSEALQLGTTDANQNTLELLRLLHSQLGGRNGTGGLVTALGGFDNLVQWGDIHSELMNYYAEMGELSRVLLLKSGGMKIHQMAGIDGTAAILSDDGTLDFATIEQNLADVGVDAGEVISALKQHPQVQQFNQSQVTRTQGDTATLEARKATLLDAQSNEVQTIVELRDTPEFQAPNDRNAERSNSTRFLEQVLVDATQVTRNRSKGTTSIKVHKSSIKRLFKQYVNSARGIGFGYIGSEQQIENLSELKIVVVDANIPHPKLPEDKLGSFDTKEGVIYLREGSSFAEANDTALHEVIHSITNKGIAAAMRLTLRHKAGEQLTAEENEVVQMYLAMVQEANDLANAPVQEEISTLQNALKAILESNASDVSKEFQLVHETLAYLGQNPNAIRGFLDQEVSSAVTIRVQGIIRNILFKFSKFLKATIGKGFMVQDKGTPILHAHLVQAALATFGQDFLQGNQTDTNATLYSDVPVESRNPAITARHDSEQVTHMNAINAIVDDSVLNKLAEVRNELDQAKLVHESAVIQTAILRDLTRLGGKLGINAEEYEVAAKVAAMFRLGSMKKFGQRAQAELMYRAAKKQLAPKDLVTLLPTDTGYAQALADATDIHHRLFRSTDTATLDRFMALSQVSPVLRKALAKVDPIREKKQVSRSIPFLSQLRGHIRNLVGQAADYITKIPRGSGDVQTFAILETVAKAKLQAADASNSRRKAFEDRVNMPLKFVLSKSGEGVRYALGAITGKDIPDGAGVTDMILSYTPNSTNVEPAGFWRTSLLEFFSRDAEHSKVADRHADRTTFRVDAERKRIHAGTSKVLGNVFARPLDDAESKALIEMEMKGDLRSLVRLGYGFDFVTQLLTDPTTVAAEENVLMQSLRSQHGLTNAQADRMITEAKGLGYRMVHGGMSKGLMNYPNALGIARLASSGSVVSASVNTKDVAALIDRLASLSAIRYASDDTKQTLAKVRTEMGEESFSKIYATQESIEQKLIKRHGTNVLNQLPKGFVPRINDAASGTKVIPASELKQNYGYEVIREVKLEHTSEKHVLVHNPVGGAVPYVSTGMSLVESTVGTGSKGDVFMKSPDPKDTSRISKTRALNWKNFGVREPIPAEAGGLVPVMNTAGNIAGYRMELTATDQANMAHPSNDWIDTLADYDGRVYEEELASQFNRQLVQSLHKLYSATSPHLRERTFVKVHSESANSQIREAWKLMPKDMKQKARATFGQSAIYVHRDDINQVLGYREKSITSAMMPEKFKEGSYKAMLAKSLQGLLGAKGYRALRLLEKGTMESVTQAKDLIVVKSIVVPAANMISNVNQLVLRGVPMEDIQRDTLLAINSKRDFDKKVMEIHEVRAQFNIEADPVKKAELDLQRRSLQAELQNNPVYTLVEEEGLNPAVIEELGEESKRDTVRQGLLDKFLPQLPEYGENGYVDMGKEVLITQDSNTYKLFNEALELGDFVGKFVLHQHLRREGVSSELAIEQVRSEFINYNRAQNSVLDYLNKTGSMFFFKYFMRIQPIIANSIAQNPARALAQVLTLTQLGIPSPYEAFLLDKDLGAATGTLDLFGMASGAHPWLSI